MCKIRIFILISLLFSLIGSSFSQQAHNPVSIYGLGEFIDNEQAIISGQGWNTNVFNDPYHINLFNASSYSYLRSTSFEVGLSAINSNWSNNTTTYKQWRGYLNYLSLAFPIFSPYNDLMEKRDRKFYWGMGFALTPFTQVDYNYLYDRPDPEAGLVTYNQTGKGGAYNIIWNNGWSYKGLSVGISSKYTFGNINKVRRISFNDYNSYLTYLTIDDRNVHLSGLSFGFSAQYTHDFNPMTEGKKTDYNKLRQLSIGANFQPLSNLNSESNAIAYTISTKTGGTYDTIAISDQEKNSNKLNSAYGVGVQYRHGSKWKASVNYDVQDYSNYDIEDLPGSYGKGSLIKAGFEYCPDATSYNSFFKRAKYRLGFKSGTLPVLINQENTKIIAGSFGLGLPLFVNRQVSHINLGVEGGQRSYGFGFTENYIKISCGFNLNDDYWFLKKKFN